MGLARVVRSMEILGHALVDMREAPDAQVVLEISAVRAVRPDLDSGMEALSERVSVLERAESGARPSPGRGAPAAGPAGADQAAPVPDAAVPPAATTSALRSGPATLHRCDAAQQGGSRRASRPPPASSPRERRPSWNRLRLHLRLPSTAATNTKGVAGSAPANQPGTRPAVPRRSIATASRRPGATASCSPCRHGPRRATPVAASSPSTRRAPTSPCPTRRTGSSALEQKAVVEAALSDHFGTNVTLVLQIDETLAPPAAARAPCASPVALCRPRRRPAGRRRRVHGPALTWRRTRRAIMHPREARLLQAFPGASEVPG